VEVSAPADIPITVSTTGASISGQVQARETGKPSAGTTVTLYKTMENEHAKGWRTFGAPAVTDQMGSYTFNGLPAGKYLLSAAVDERVPVPLGESETTHGVLLFTSSGYRVHGRVLDALSSAPIEGARVSWGDASSSVSRVVLSNAEGEYALSNVPANYEGKQVLVAEKAGYQLVGRMTYDRQPQVDVVFRPGSVDATRDLHMIQLVPLHGEVRDADRQPVSGALVDIGDRYNPVTHDLRAARTDGDGRFTVYAPIGSRMIVSAQKVPLPVAISPVISVETSTPLVTLTLRPAATFSGRVVGPDDQPVAGASIIVSGQGDRAVTDGAGNFTLEKKDQRQPDVGITAEKPGFSRSEWLHFKLQPGESTQGLLLKLGTSHFIRGKVTDTAGHPIPGVRIHAEDINGNMQFMKEQTNEDGVFRLENIPPGKKRLTFYPLRTNGISYKMKELSDFAVDQENVAVTLEAEP
jgi:5-hydroxyisourate hydrolase-like protein (transthyretin family)